jgi:hypothetical protein
MSESRMSRVVGEKRICNPSGTQLLALPGHSSHVNAGATGRFGGNIVSASASRSVV